MASEQAKQVIKKTLRAPTVPLDELLTQLEHDDASADTEDSPPIEITDQVKEKMIRLMDTYLTVKQQLERIKAAQKDLQAKSDGVMHDLETLMRLYGLTELIKGENKFVLDQTVRKVPLKKEQFREVISHVVGDPSVVEQIY